MQDVAAKGAALAQGPVHMVRGTSEQEMLLKNARTEFKDEAEEIAHYTAIQTLAKVVGDRETAQLAKAILREEKRMAGFLEKLIPRLTQAVAQAEIPPSERNGGRRPTSRRRTTSRSTSARSGSGRGGSTRTERSTSRSQRHQRSTAARSGTKRSTSARSGTASRRKTSARSGSSARSAPRAARAGRPRAHDRPAHRSSGTRSK